MFRQFYHARQVRPCWGVSVFLLALGSGLAGLARATESTEGSARVSFTREIAPLLAQECLSCHNPEKAKGGYRLDTFDAMMKAGDSGQPPIVPGAPGRSRLFALVTTTEVEDRMPQKDDPLTATEVALLRRWINEGAGFDGADRNAPLAELTAPRHHPPPPARYRKPVPVRALAFHPGDGSLAAGGYHEVTFWNPTNGALLHRLTNAPQQIHALAFEREGSVLAVAGGAPGRSGELRLFDLRSNAPPRVLLRTRDVLLTAVFSSDGRRLTAGGTDNTVRMFDVATGRPQFAAEVHGDWITALALDGEGRQIVSASRDKTVRLLDSKTGELELTYVGHTAPVLAVAFSPDGQQIASAGRDREIHLWEAKSGKKLGEIKGFAADVLRLAWVEDRIISGAADGKARVHSAKDLKQAPLLMLTGHDTDVTAIALDEARGWLASGSFDGEVRIWNLSDGTLVTRFIASPGLRHEDGPRR
ncbi:MAG TPA: c-type cytochrome domain-containing protein [Methylomirabilota bacterium]|nr:c-type cytochrome domain-containing protein [Methylomirabilota bacterium]